MLTLTYRGRTLLGVPAVHNRAVFAEMVNRLCADEATRPAAIALELDPSAAAAIAAWLGELGVAPGAEPLPCMLGLTRENRRIHPLFRAAALRLQEKTGYQLHELPPDLLYRELRYAPQVLLCLTPTDSTIEAIRCALELNIPLWGIDHEHAPAPRERSALHARDPLAARGDLAGYVRRLGRQADLGRDEHTDGRRETVMAARLKALLGRYDHVLWTGGLAHWPSLCRLLADERLPPAIEVPRGDPGGYQRVVVHPQEAVRQMDLFPRITAAYEVARQPVNPCAVVRADVDFEAQFRHCLEAAFVRCADADASGPGSARGHHGLMSFTRYLVQVCLLAERPVPDMATALSVARAMMPGAFVRSLADALMDFDWASPARFGDLPIIGPDGSAKPRAGEEAHRVVLRTPLAEDGGAQPAYTDSDPFHISPLNGWRGPGIAGYGWQWQEEPAETTTDPSAYGYRFVWPPCENLFYVTIYEAIHVADARALEHRTEPCVGSLQDGIDLKATLRASLQGKRQLLVKRTLRRPRRPLKGEPVTLSYSPHLEQQPTVFLFSPESAERDSSWECLNAGTDEVYDDLSERGKRLFRSVVTPGSHIFLESISCAEDAPLPAEMRPWVRGLRLLHGAVRFGNPCVNFYQAAAWLEKGRFRAAPILQGSWSTSRAVAMYLEQHHLAIDIGDWPSALILLALPYARATRRVVVVCPKTFRVGEEVRREAKRRGVELFTLPLSHFPAARIEQIRRQYSVMAGPGGKEFPPELERIFGQKESTYRDLLPLEIRRQSKPRPSSVSEAGESMEVDDVAHHHG